MGLARIWDNLDKLGQNYYIVFHHFLVHNRRHAVIVDTVNFKEPKH